MQWWQARIYLIMSQRSLINSENVRTVPLWISMQIPLLFALCARCTLQIIPNNVAHNNVTKLERDQWVGSKVMLFQELKDVDAVANATSAIVSYFHLVCVDWELFAIWCATGLAIKV